MDKVEPIVLSYEDGQEYVIEFSRETVAQAEKAGFSLDDVEEKMMLRIPQLMYWGLKMHHPTISKEKAEKILFDDLGGVSSEIIERLVKLYAAGYNTLVNETGKPKNPKLTVRL